MQALSPANMEHLKETFDNLNKTTASLSESSKKFDGVIEKADGTMGFGKEAADNLQLAMGDARKTHAGRRAGYERSDSGNGLLATLLTNEEVANNLRALISNLRRHGVLFYRDSAAKVSPPPPQSTPVPRRRDTSLGKMTPQLTVNLLRVLFVTFCGAVGSLISAEAQDNAIPGLLIGLVFGLDPGSGRSSAQRVSRSALFPPRLSGLLLGLFFANLLLASEVLRYQSEETQWIAAPRRLLRLWLPRHDARDAEQPR